MPKFIVQNQPYFAEDGDLKKPGTVVDIPLEKASFTNGWIVCDDQGNPKMGKDNKPVTLTKPKKDAVPVHLMGTQSGAGPALSDVRAINELMEKTGEALVGLRKEIAESVKGASTKAELDSLGQFVSKTFSSLEDRLAAIEAKVAAMDPSKPAQAVSESKHPKK